MSTETDSGLPDPGRFHNKVLGLFIDHPAHADGQMLVMEGVKFCEFGGRLFATGTFPRREWDPTWADGLEVYVAWEAVSYYYVFDDMEDYRKRTKSPSGFLSKLRRS